ncbi:Transposon Ty3-I Gag-Pol polyprotein [Ceratobasidium sp. AG-Ba]|nr:Transposon Ty3-I Gag-Pol polyprotein [Ceratobasidium sp. AG-Ba]
MSNVPSAGTSGEPESTVSVGGAPNVPVPIQSPAGVAAFGGISGPSPIISVTVLPRTESAGVGGGTHIANPSAQETQTESELTTPNYSEDEGVTKEESPSVGASERSKARSSGLGRTSYPPGTSGKEPEGESTPKGVRFESYEGDDETLKKEFDDKVLAEKNEYISNCQSLHDEIQAEKEAKESELKSLLKKEKYRLLGPVYKKLKLYEEEYNQQIQDYEERLKLTAPEIRERSRKEREAERRKRGSILTTQEQRDYDLAKSIAEIEEKKKELEELNKKINETRISGESSKGKGREVPRSTIEPRKSRVSLGLTVPVMHSRNPYTPFKIEPVATQLPVGGYLGTALATSTPKERLEQSPSPPPPPTRRPVPLYIPGQTRAPARVPTEEPTEACQGAVEAGAVVEGTMAAGAVAAGEPDGDGSDSSGSDNDSDYRKMSGPEKSAYRKGKKKMKEARRAQKAVERTVERERREKIEKLKLSGYKMKLPSQYDGTPNMEIFEQWHYEVETFLEDTGITGEEEVKFIKSFLKSKAAAFYMRYVATRPDQYTFETLSRELFEHCFPPNILDEFRGKFHSLKQGDRPIRDFVRELQRYQTWLGDISDKQVAYRVWAGAKSHLRSEWMKAGVTPERHSLDFLEETGTRFEMAKRILQAEEKNNNSGNRDKPFKPFKPHKQEGSSTEMNKVSYSASSNNTRATFGSNRTNNQNYSKNKVKPKPQGPKLTNQQLEEHRAAGKCFLCSEVGHNKRDCPKRNTARPTGLSSSSINYARIEALGAKRPELSISAVDFNAEGLEIASESEDDSDWEDEETICHPTIELNAARTKKSKGNWEIERNSAIPKDLERRTSAALVVEMFVNGKSCRVLLDSGSLGDFISTTIVDQLKIKAEVLAKPMGLSMAVTGSRSQVKHSVVVNIKYQGIDNTYRLDVANLDRYDLILGTPFLHTHSIALAFNPHSVLVRSTEPLPLEGPQVRTIESCAMEVYEKEIEKIREMLVKESEDICKKASETPLPPLRAINHRIPIIDKNKTYSWRSSRCPEALRGQWETKLKAYLDTGRWEFATGKNAIPMLLIPKKGTEGESTLRTVLDKREQNANTYKVASPLPDIQEILWKVSQYKYRTLIDGKDAYEQIRVEPEDVEKTLFSTPSGTMISRVMQIGDTNATATYQSLMNHLFKHAIGVYMHVFLDDIVIFTNGLEEHVQRVREVFEVLRREKFFLSPKKMQFLAEKLEILGHIVDSKGIQMDPHKVDSVMNWKVPNTKEQLMSFLGAVGYLAPNCAGIRIPMGLLTSRGSVHKHWNWDATAQRAFEEIKEIVNKWRDHHRVAINYSKGAPPINLVTDASLTGASGILSQGEDPRTAKIAMFWSGKFTATQQNYPVHELELYAIRESLEKFQYQLYGTKFRIYTDNKSLVHLMTQKNLSPRQARWLEFINEFYFDIIHITGEENKVADALSRMYADEPEGMVRAKSEYLKEDEDSEDRMELSNIDFDERAPLTCPLLVGNAVIVDKVPEKETEAIGAVSEGAPTEEAVIEAEAPDQVEPKEQILRRSGRERKPVAKYVQPPQAPRKPRKPTTAETAKVGKGKPIGDEQVAPKVESETPKKDLDKIEERVTGESAYTGRENTRAYFDASPTFLDGIKDKYSGDNLLAKVVRNPSQFKNFGVSDGLIYIKQNSGKAICVPDVEINGRRAREEAIKSTHEMLRHAGSRKTLYAMRGRVWWDTMVPDTKEYCQSCVTCATAKTTTQSKLGLLTPLKRPAVPWERISIDFVGPLPESENLLGKWDMMLVAVDYATSMVRIIPTRQTFRAKEVAELMYENIYKIHGIPKVIVSDRDSLFTSTFWSESNRLMGVQTRMSSAYHPETDGATERANKTIGSMLRQCIKGRQSDWVRYLAGIEYAMNSSVSETTGYSPFYLNYGRVPPPMVWETENEYAGVRMFLLRQREALMRAHDAIIGARVRQTEQANKHRKLAEFKVGDLVYLSSKNMRLPARFSRKLTPKYIGPHRIVQEITEGTTYKVELPKELGARGINPVFHASLLRIHVPNDDRKFPGRSAEQIVALDKEPKEWAVDKIITHAGKGRDAEFQILWKSGDRSWESFERIRHLEAMDAYLEAQGVSDATELRWTDPLEEDLSDEEQEVEQEAKGKSPDIEMNRIEIYEINAHLGSPMRAAGPYKECEYNASSSAGYSSLSRVIDSTNSLFFYSMYTLNPRNTGSLSLAQLDECITYRNALGDYRRGRGDHPGVEPRSYQMYRAIMMNEGEREAPVPSRAGTNARFIASETGQVADTTATAIQALLEAQEEMREAIRNMADTNRTRRPTEVVVPPTPHGFNGMITTSLASRIGAPTAPKGAKRPVDPRLLYGNKSKRFAPYARNKKAWKGTREQAPAKPVATPSVPATTGENAGTPKPPEEPSPVGTSETTSSETNQSGGSNQTDSSAFRHFSSTETDHEELDWGSDIELPDYDPSVGNF